MSARLPADVTCEAGTLVRESLGALVSALCSNAYRTVDEVVRASAPRGES